MSGRITQRFADLKAAGRTGLVAYLTAGDPTPGQTAELALALARGGADVIELGMPFSDPVADGPVIQRASERALKAGTTLQRVLEIAREIRRQSDVPLLLFSYMNPLVRHGFARLAAEAGECGIDGCLITDLSVEEAENYVATMRAATLDTVFLAAPTSTARRLELIARYSSGFVYAVSRTGITGERDSVAASVGPLVHELRRFTDLPIAVGFGVSKPEHVAQIGRHADAAVVGSAIVRLIDEHSSDPRLAARLEDFARKLKG